MAMPVAANTRENLPAGRLAPEFAGPEKPMRGHAGGSGNHDLDTVPNAEWDEIILGFEDVSYDQTAAYSCARWGAEKSSHLLVRDGENIVAGARVVEITIPGLRKGLAFVKFGPFWRRRNQSADPDAYISALGALTEEYCDRRGLLLTVQPRPSLEFGAFEQKALKAKGFVNRRRHADQTRFLVNLSLDEDAQRASLGQRWRRNLKKSSGSKMDIGLVTGVEAHRQFQALHVHMIGRKKDAPGEAIDLLPSIENELPAALAPVTVIASHDGRPVAGAVIALHGDTAYYVFGASNAKALPLRAGFALQWWIVRWLSDRGLRWYDLGGTRGADGLKQFKTGLIGRHGSVIEMPGEYDKWNNDSDRIAADALFAVRALSKQAAGLRGLRFWR